MRKRGPRRSKEVSNAFVRAYEMGLGDKFDTDPAGVASQLGLKPPVFQEFVEYMLASKRFKEEAKSDNLRMEPTLNAVRLGDESPFTALTLDELLDLASIAIDRPYLFSKTMTLITAKLRDRLSEEERNLIPDSEVVEEDRKILVRWAALLLAEIEARGRASGREEQLQTIIRDLRPMAKGTQLVDPAG